MSVEERLVRLERENRRLKLVGLLMLVVVGSVFLMGQARPSRQVVAESFTLVNEQGEVVGELSSSGGATGLNLYSPGTSSRFPLVSLGISNNTVGKIPYGPGLSLYSSGTSPFMRSGIRLEVDTTDEAPKVTFTDKMGRSRLEMSLVEGDIPFIRVSDEQLNTLWVAPPR